MVKNAYNLHKRKDKISRFSMFGVTSSTNALALLNFKKYSNGTEMTGGFFWLWKGISSGSLVREHGIMINARLKIANLLQFFVVIAVPFVFLITATEKDKEIAQGKRAQKQKIRMRCKILYSNVIHWP